MTDIFLSYASQDRERVIPLVEALEADGYSVWWDRNIRPGPSFDREIETALKETSCMVVVWSHDSVESEWVRNEVDDGARRGILVPVLIDDVLPPLAYRRRQSANLAGWAGERDGEYQQLLTGIRAILDGSGEAGAGTSSLPSPLSTRQPRRAKSSRVGTMMAGSVVGALLATVALISYLNWDTRSPYHTSYHYDLAFAEHAPIAFVGAASLGNGRMAFTISPDGKRVVYVGLEDGLFRLYMRELDGHEARALQGTENAYGPFFSPNSRWIGFFVGNQMKKVRVEGGDPVTLAEVTYSTGASWGTNNEIVVATDEGDRLQSISAQGGKAEILLEKWANFSDLLPGDSKMLVSLRPDLEISVLDIATGDLETLSVRGSDPRYENGFLFFTREGSLYAMRFDPATLETGVTPVPVLTSLRVEVYGRGQWSVSASGTLLYASGFSVVQSPFQWVRGTTATEQLEFSPRLRGSFEISPDGRLLAVVERSAGDDEIWLYDLLTGQSRKLTIGGNNDQPLVWMPNGNSIIYHKALPSGYVAYLHELDVSKADEPVLPEVYGGDVRISSVSSDGRYYGTYNRKGLWVVDSETNEKIDLPGTDSDSWGTAIAPNGRAVVYTSSESGTYQNFLQPLPPTGQRYQISRAGDAEEPRWSPDGTKVYYRSGRRIMAVSVTISPEISIGAPEVFFEGEFVNVGGRSYDIDRKGQQALVLRDVSTSSSSVRVITNWFDIVERMVAESER